MNKLTSAIKTFVSDEGGATAIEYGLIAALIAVAIVASLEEVRDGLVGLFASVVDGLSGA